MPKTLTCTLMCFVASVCISACSTLKDPELRPNYPEKWRNASSGNIEATQDAWWLALNDATLNETIALAQKQNLSIAQSSERLIAARSINESIIANQRPQVGFTAGPDNLARAIETSSGNSSSTSSSNFRTKGAYLAGFDLNWELPFFGRGDSQRKIGKSDVNQAIANLQATKVSITAEIVRTYGSLRTAQEKSALLMQQVINYQTLDTVYSQAIDAGMLSKAEYDGNRNALIEAKNLQISEQAQQELALLRLSVLCGLSSPLSDWTAGNEKKWSLTHSYTVAPNPPAELIRQRPDIAQAEATVMNAAGQAGIAHADIYPKFTIQGALQVAGSLSNARPTRVISVIAPTVSLPIIDWGLARQVANARDAKLREAILGYSESVLLAIEETETAFTHFNAAEQHLAIQEDESERWGIESTRGESAYNAGYIGRGELLKTQMKLIERHLQESDTKLEWITAFALVNKTQAKMRDDFYNEKK